MLACALFLSAGFCLVLAVLCAVLQLSFGTEKERFVWRVSRSVGVEASGSWCLWAACRGVGVWGRGCGAGSSGVLLLPFVSFAYVPACDSRGFTFPPESTDQISDKPTYRIHRVVLGQYPQAVLGGMGPTLGPDCLMGPIRSVSPVSVLGQYLITAGSVLDQC